MSIQDLVKGNPPRDLQEQILSGLLSLSRPLYRAGAAVHRKMYEKGIKKVRSLPCRVVCIGNLTLGGSGKTPVTILAAKRLSEEGKRVVIISRGYKRKRGEKNMVVVQDTQKILASPLEAGDEPYLIAESLPGIPVIVCANRFIAGEYACRNFNPDILILDDGFQHWGLKRDCDIVCIDSGKPLDKLKLLPRGLLREPIEGLKRAQAVIFTRTEKAERLNDQINIVKKIAGNIPVLRLRFQLGELLPVSKEESTNFTEEDYFRKPVMAFCGIANPESFFRLIKQKFKKLEKTIVFPDHVSYTKEHFRSIKSEFVYYNCHIAITTEKDAVKIRHMKLHRMPIYFFNLNTVWEKEQDSNSFTSVLKEAKKP